MALRTDVHQHLWPTDVLRCLEGRTSAPGARWHDGGWTVTLAAEPAFRIDPAEHDAELRAAEVRAAGLDRALVALSAPVGAEAVPGVAEAWHAAAQDLPAELGWWAAGDDPDLVAASLTAGAAGLCLPAGALCGESAVEALGPVLGELEARLAPLFVHPGPARLGRPDDAPWWSPCTDYVAQMQAAWHAVVAWVRPRHPGLRVLFALGAGLAPVNAERTVLRGGPAGGVEDPLLFYDTSGSGPRALRSMSCAVGEGQLVFGSDAPVVPLRDAVPAGAPDAAQRLLGEVWVAA